MSLGSFETIPYIIGATLIATNNLHQLAMVGSSYADSTFNYIQLDNSQLV